MSFAVAIAIVIVIAVAIAAFGCRGSLKVYIVVVKA